MPIEEIENPMEEDDEDQLVVVGAADEALESPKVQLLRFEAKQVRSAHFEYKSDEESIDEDVRQVGTVTDDLPEKEPEVEADEAEFIPILRARVPSKRTAVRHDDEVASKRQVIEAFHFVS